VRSREGEGENGRAWGLNRGRLRDAEVSIVAMLRTFAIGDKDEGGEASQGKFPVFNMRAIVIL
jgi:hypothetical protein